MRLDGAHLQEPVMVRILQYPGVTGCTEAFG
jgi:hypothetical protein